jgi:hypothetical protein
LSVATIVLCELITGPVLFGEIIACIRGRFLSHNALIWLFVLGIHLIGFDLINSIFLAIICILQELNLTISRALHGAMTVA